MLRAGDVLLCPLRMADFRSWARLREASRDHLTPFEPSWTLDELSRSAFRERVRRAELDARAGAGFAFLIFARGGAERSEGHVVGGISLTNVRRGVAQACSVGYWIGAAHTRRGHASSALAAVSEFAFGQLHLNRIEAACMPGNMASLRTLERAGFRREGIARQYLRINGAWEDHVLFALTADDWSEAPAR